MFAVDVPGPSKGRLASSHWCCRVKYYFAQIYTSTDIMTDLFAKE